MLSKKELTDLYITQRLSAPEIASSESVSARTVYNWLEKCGIPRRQHPNRPSTVTIAGDVAYVEVHRRSGEPLQAVIDAEDVSKVSHLRWCLNKEGGYVRSSAQKGRVMLHRLVLGTPAHLLTDHKDGDHLNNRKGNLRPVTPAQNLQNAQTPRGGTSGHRGVHLGRDGLWVAQAGPMDGRRYLGRFDSEETAAKAAKEWRKVHMPFSEADKN